MLSNLCHRDDLFRFNTDQWASYEIHATPNSVVFTDPTGRTIDALDASVILLWRKPIPHPTEFEAGRPDRTILSSQLVALLRGIYRTLLPNHQVSLVEPEGENRLAKIFQLNTASRYFDVPEWELSNNVSSISADSTITKMLGTPQLPDGRIIYTTAVEKENLCRPFPWFLQESISRGSDVTCVFIAGECFYFRCTYNRSAESLDWRTEIGIEGESAWIKIPSEEIGNPDGRIRELMNEWNIHYGRLDFIQDTNGKLWFLECNPNGQFGWLDDRESFWLHKRFLEAVLSKNSRVS